MVRHVQSSAPLRVCSAVQRHESSERPILPQISSLIYPNIQRRQVIMNVLNPSCVRPPRWSPPGRPAAVLKKLSLCDCVSADGPQAAVYSVLAGAVGPRL